MASGGPKVGCCIPWDVENRILYRAPHIATVTADTADAAPPGMRRIKDLSAGDLLIEDDGTIVEVTSALDTFDGQFRVVVIRPSGMKGIRRWPHSKGDDFVELAPPLSDE